MFDYDKQRNQLLPNLDQFLMSNSSQKEQQTRNNSKYAPRQASEDCLSSSGASLCSCSSSSSSTAVLSQSKEKICANKDDKKRGSVGISRETCIQLFSVPAPLINNSALVRQRAKDHLAVASLATGASLPLMIGGRSRCVVNVLSDEPDLSDKGTISTKADEMPQQQQQQPNGPRNTAIRAEQRRQNMSVSVVRPIVSSAAPICEPFSKPINQSSDTTASGNLRRAKLEESPLWPAHEFAQKSSIIDDFMALDNSRQMGRSSTREHLMDPTGEMLLLSGRFEDSLSFGSQAPPDDEFVEQRARQQLLLFKREELELNRGIKRQHRFVVAKLEERKRGLQIVNSVWVQRDFKHAIEKLVDLYHQGLIFTNNCPQSRPTVSSANKFSIPSSSAPATATLSSLNTPIVVDVISVIILRPKLWSLDICQLLLPILINDLLVVYEHHRNQSISSSLRGNEQEPHQYEYYTEVALKALKLIINQFGPVIKNTLDSEKDSKRLLAGGVDLSREERLNKCLSCLKLLMEAKQVIAKGSQSFLGSASQHNKLAALYREIKQSFEALQLPVGSTDSASKPGQHQSQQQAAKQHHSSAFRRTGQEQHCHR